MQKNYLETNNQIHGLAVAQLWLILGVLLLSFISPTTTAEPPEPSDERGCLSYAFTESDNHYFLLSSNKSAFGTNMTIKHNCPYIEVFINGNFSAFTEMDQLKIPLSVGNNDITIISDNYSKNISSVYIFPDRLSWEFDYYEWQNSDQDYTFDELILRSKVTAQKNWVSILSVVMVFTLVTMVYWNLINSYVDRNYCEEVKR